MNIALVLFDWFAHGGLQRDCRRIGESLVARDARVDILCMNRDGDIPEGMLLIQAANARGNSVTARRKFTAFLKRHLAQRAYDAVIGFNRVPGLDYYFAADTCFAWKARHERGFFYRLAPRSRQYLAFEKAVFGANSPTRLFMLSPLQKKEYLACYPGAADRMTDIPPGIAKDRMAPDDAAEIRRQFREAFAIADDELLLLQVGSTHPVKGVDRTLLAMAALPQSLRSRTRLFVLGDDKRGRHTKQAGALGIAERVSFLPGRNDLPRFYQGADLLLQPSRKESAGMAILEGIVAGLPVLATATCGYAFHVEKADAGRVITEPFSQAVLNEALASMLDGRDRPRWRENGIAYGRTGDFYAMPDRVADRVLADIRVKDHAG